MWHASCMSIRYFRLCGTVQHGKVQHDAGKRCGQWHSGCQAGDQLLLVVPLVGWGYR